MLLFLGNRRPSARLSEKEVLALAISSEEDDARIYATYADRLRKDYPATAAMLDDMVVLLPVDAADGERRPGPTHEISRRSARP